MFNDCGERQHLYNPSFVLKARERRRQEAIEREREIERQKEREREERKRLAAEAAARDPLGPLRRAGFPGWAINIICRVAAKHDIAPTTLITSPRRAVAYARYEAIYEMKREKPSVSSSKMGRWFRRDHTSILYGIARHAAINNLTQLSNFDASGKIARANNWYAAHRQAVEACRPNH